MSGAVLQTFAEEGQRVRAGSRSRALDDVGAARPGALGASARDDGAELLDIAQRELSRTQTLEKAGAIAERDLEQARNARASPRRRSSATRAARSSPTCSKQLDKASVAGAVRRRRQRSVR